MSTARLTPVVVSAASVEPPVGAGGAPAAAVPAVAVIVTVASPFAPLGSVTVTFAVNVPAVLYWWLTLVPPAAPPSPKSHT